MQVVAPSAAVQPLSALQAHERLRFGNKAWHLACLARAGLPVPAGFCIAGDAIPSDWCAAVPPPAVAVAICAAYRRIGAPLVAVRSSADDEDLPERSAAGLYRSLLGVRGEEALLAAVMECWRARLAPRAQLGRPATLAPRMAILVQLQVPAAAAGVMFTADPLTGATDHIVINAVWGLGEPLASGRICGDIFHATPTGVLARQALSCKTAMLTAAGERSVPHWRRHAPALNAQQVRRLVELARRVQALFPLPAGQALDIEFAFERDQPVLLQARPVPALRPRPDPLAAYLAEERQTLAAQIAALRAQGILRGTEFVLSAGNIGELLPTPSAFSFGLFRHIFAGTTGAIVRGRRRLGYRLGEHAGAGLFVEFGGQAYFNLEADAATYDSGVALPLPELLAAVAQDPARANYPELDLYPCLLAATPGGATAASAFRRDMLRHGRRLQQRMPRLLPQFAVAPLPPLAGLDVAALQAMLTARLARLRSVGVRFVMAARLGFFFADILRRRLQTLLPQRAERVYASLLQGLPGSLITAQSLDLERLARGEIDCAGFLARYGHMASNELELLHPRLAETPERLLRQVADLRASGRRPAREFARQARRRQRTQAALLRQFAAHPALAELRDDIGMAQAFLPLRETIKFHLAAHYAALRPLLHALAAQLGCAAESLFHLTPEEVVALVPQARDTWGALAAQRRERRELARRVARCCPLPQVVFGSRLDEIGEVGKVGAGNPLPAGADDLAAPSLSARPIAPGIAEGIVHCLTLEDEELDAAPPELGGGEILVTTSANLGLAPLFRTAAGVVVEVGGVLAHCACQAREAGIPALVLPDAMRLLRHGDRVRIDAGRGLITIIERQGGAEGATS